ncbi:hypothetical protein, partial [Achromobacter phage kwar_LB4]
CLDLSVTSCIITFGSWMRPF